MSQPKPFTPTPSWQVQHKPGQLKPHPSLTLHDVKKIIRRPEHLSRPPDAIPERCYHTPFRYTDRPNEEWSQAVANERLECVIEWLARRGLPEEAILQAYSYFRDNEHRWPGDLEFLERVEHSARQSMTIPTVRDVGTGRWRKRRRLPDDLSETIFGGSEAKEHLVLVRGRSAPNRHGPDEEPFEEYYEPDPAA